MFGHGYEIPVMVPLCECGRTDAQYDGMLTPDAVTRCRVQLQVDTLAQPQARTAQPLLRMPIGQEDAHNGRHTDPFSAPPRATDAQEPPSACWPEEAWVFVMKDPKDHSRQGMMQIRDLRAGLLLRPPVKGQRPQVIKRITPYPRRRRKTSSYASKAFGTNSRRRIASKQVEKDWTQRPSRQRSNYCT